jgi:RNA polymerase sigma-70 factor (ECF subfamily)
MVHPPTPPIRDDTYQRFTSLLVTHQPAILGFIRTLLPQTSEAEDLLQKTCLIAWQKFDQFDETTKFSTWACQIAYYEVKNYLRTKARDRHVFSDEVLDYLAQETPEEQDRLAAERAALHMCVQTLAADERELLSQAYTPDTTVQQIAVKLGRSANSLYKQLNRIRRRLHGCITARLKEGGAA